MSTARARHAGQGAFLIEWLDPATLIPHPLNDKQHSTRQRAELERSLREFGWLAAPIWNRRTGLLLDGHERREEALRQRWPSIPVRVVDVDARTERRMLAAFDRIGELRGRDEMLLARLLREVTGEDEPPPPGYDQAEVDTLLALVAPPVDRPRADVEDWEAPDGAADRADAPANGGGASDPQHGVSHVKVVNLYLTPEQHDTFLAHLEALAARYSTANLTDTAVAALHEGWERHHVGAAAAEPGEPG